MVSCGTLAAKFRVVGFFFQGENIVPKEAVSSSNEC